MMAAVKSDMDRAAPGHCRIMIRLREVRARVHDSLSWGTPSEGPNAEGTDILAGILGVAIAARTESLATQSPKTCACGLIQAQTLPPRTRISDQERPAAIAETNSAPATKTPDGSEPTAPGPAHKPAG